MEYTLEELVLHAKSVQADDGFWHKHLHILQRPR